MRAKAQISILIPVFNRENYIGETIDSILHQSIQDFEIVICDDCSTDKTIDVIKSYNDTRVKLLCNAENRGISYTRNKLLKSSVGEYIAILDSDDVAMPDRLAKQIDFFFKHPEIDVVGSYCTLIDQNGNTKRKVIKYKSKPEEIKCALVFYNCFIQSTIMFRRKILRHVFYDLAYNHAEDYDLWGRLSLNFSMANIEEALTYYRLHFNNITATTKNQAIFSLNSMITKKLINSHFNYTPDDYELLLHNYIYQPELTLNKKFLEDSAVWLSKIMQLNAKCKVFSFTVLSKLVSESWYKRCKSAAETGYLFSGLSYLTQNPVRGRASFFCLTKILTKALQAKYNKHFRNLGFIVL